MTNPLLNNSICIVGHAQAAADVALRHVLKFKTVDGPLIILDYKGRGAAILGESNMRNLHKKTLYWYDLADRVRPVSLFHLPASTHFAEIMRWVLTGIRDVPTARISDAALQWTVELAAKLSNEGTVGLGALVKTLGDPAVRRWFLDTQPDSAELGKVARLLSWALRFPSVYAVSEGDNRENLRRNVEASSTTWIEAHYEHLERCEHRIAFLLVEAAVHDALQCCSQDSQNGRNKAVPTVLHLFPVQSASGVIARWITNTCENVRHIAVHAFDSARPLSRGSSTWAACAAQLWVLKSKGPMAAEAHGRWLGAADIKRFNALDRGSVLIRNNRNQKILVAKAGESLGTPGIAHRIRIQANKNRTITKIRQMGQGVPAVASRTDGDGLYDKLWTRETLRSGWFRVATANKSSHGCDNITVAMFRDKLEQELDRLSDQLRSRTYRSRPLRRVNIPKEDGTQRSLGLACVRDRVVQCACLGLLDPVFDPGFSNFSFGFRNHRSAHQALTLVRSFIASGCQWAVIADIRKCFDNLDHDVLMELVEKKVRDPAMLELIRHLLTVDVIDFRDLMPTDIGVPQGGAISPLLTNVYLDPLDKHLERLGLHFVRYADDITILTPTEEEAKRALGILGDFLHNPLHLALKPAKTNVVPVSEGFDILGFRMSTEHLEVQKKKLDKAAEALREQLKVIGSRKSSLDEKSTALGRTNAIIRGFRNYFLFPREKRILEQMNYLDGRAEQMAHLYLPPAVRDDPAWICRERFCVPTIDGEEIDFDTAVSPHLNAALGGYGKTPANWKPPGWMIKSDEKGGDTPTEQPALLIGESPEERNDRPPRASETIVEHADRLYVLAHGGYLGLEDNDLVVKRNRSEIYRRPMSRVGLLYLQGMGMNISVSLQVRLAEMDIPAVFAPPVGAPTAVLTPIQSSRSFLRGMQVTRRNDPDMIAAGLRMLAAKIGNQSAMLRYFAKYRKTTDENLAREMNTVADELRNISEQVRALDPGDAAVRPMGMGYEGRAAAQYWKQLSRLAPAEMQFEGRITRNAGDVVNQCINYVYGMLYGEVWRAVVKAGLDPYFGFVHGSERNQGSLVFDMIEEFRAPFADRIVFGMVGRGFKPETGAHGFLRTRCRRPLSLGFAKRWTKPISWRSQEITPARILEKQAASLVKLIKREGNYHPFRMRW